MLEACKALPLYVMPKVALSMTEVLTGCLWWIESSCGSRFCEAE
jgi:hypothetical protein